MRTVRERSAAAPAAAEDENREEAAWWLRAASRDPNGTPARSYCTRRYTSTTVTASQSSTHAITIISRAIADEYTGPTNADD